VRISCPPIAHPCFYGIDFPTSEELVAGGMSVEQIRDYIEADSLGYLSLEGLFSPFRASMGFCAACFDGKYPTDISGIRGKHDLERSSELDLDL